MNREDRELLAELRRLNSDVVPLAMKIMDESVMVTAQEQYAFARRLMAMGRRLEGTVQGRPAGGSQMWLKEWWSRVWGTAFLPRSTEQRPSRASSR
ncbi:MAG: hypothetical protein LC808_32455 [Actinobacteria bacterium]|nr:hypothetical protein [Actinomycetota bacterium]